MKQYNEIEWNEFNLYKNEEKHGVQYWEIEEAFENEYVIFRGEKKKCAKKLEKRKVLLGETMGGRRLFIVFEDKGSGKARLILARNMEEYERRIYDEKVKK